MKTLLALSFAILLSGCAQMQFVTTAGLDARQQAHDALMAVGIQTLQFADDYARLQAKAAEQLAARNAAAAKAGEPMQVRIVP